MSVVFFGFLHQQNWLLDIAEILLKVTIHHKPTHLFCREFYLSLIVHFYVYWCPSRLSFQMILMSFNSNTTGVTCRSGTAYPSGEPEFTPTFSVLFLLLDLFRVDCSFFVLLHLANVLSVHQFTISNYPFGIFKLFVSRTIEKVKYINDRPVSRSHEQVNTQMCIWCSEP